MIEKGEVITLENNEDYVVSNVLKEANKAYYLLLKLEDETEVSEDFLIVKENDENSFEIVIEEEFNYIKRKFVDALIEEEQKDENESFKTAHIKTPKKDISPLVLMPGDPLRAKFAAENFLDNYRLVNDVRNNYAYTGYYKGVMVTIMGSGMGMPCAGIYYHELFDFYDVQKIIRIGTCGATTEDQKLMDVVIANKSYTNSNFAETYCGRIQNIAYSSKNLTENLISASKENNINSHVGGSFTMDFFGPYINMNKLRSQIPDGFDTKAEEMECFGLFLIASELKKDAGCILTIVDSPFDKNIVSSDERETGLKNMIKIALDAIIK
ncbi:MAG: purine-nucleoside phosphorylase [Bacilli bacterium]|nr:purine-nucleoside phosphorylase [Bacilli bacterium]